MFLANSTASSDEVSQTKKSSVSSSTLSSSTVICTHTGVSSTGSRVKVCTAGR